MMASSGSVRQRLIAARILEQVRTIHPRLALRHRRNWCRTSIVFFGFPWKGPGRCRGL